MIVARVTTQSHSSTFDLTITKWKQAGLLAFSHVLLHKLATLEKSLVSSKLGELTVNDRQSVSAILPQLFKDW